MTMRLVILGCGSSGGVPRIGGEWGACDPANPKNRRTRCSVLIERTGASGTTTALIDSSPDIREQLLRTGTAWVDGVCYTHDHADHTHGIDDLRMIAYNGRRKVKVYADDATMAVLNARFGYCFATPPGSSYPPILEPHRITPHQPLTIAGAGGPITLLPFLQHHGDMPSLGFRVGPVAYSPDVSALPEAAIAALAGVDVWIVDALRYTYHPSHFTVAQALDAVGRIQPRRAILTHLHVDLDYARLQGELPAGVEPAFDGLTVEWDEGAGQGDATAVLTRTA